MIEHDKRELRATCTVFDHYISTHGCCIDNVVTLETHTRYSSLITKGLFSARTIDQSVGQILTKKFFFEHSCF